MARHLLAWIAVLLAIGGTAGGLGYYKYAEIRAAIAAAEDRAWRSLGHEPDVAPVPEVGASVP